MEWHEEAMEQEGASAPKAGLLTECMSGVANKISKSYVKIRIIVSFVQVLSGTGTVFDIRWPPIFSRLLNVLGIFTLDFINLMPIDCIYETNYHFSLVVGTLWPLTALGIVFASRAYLLRSRSESHHIIADHLLTFIFAVFFVIYPTVSFKISAMFQCITLDDEEQSRFLRVDFSVDCKSEAHQYMRLYAGLMVFVYPIGIPSLYVYLLYVRFGRQMHRLRDISKLRESIYNSALCRTGYERSKPAEHEMTQLRYGAGHWSTGQAAENAASTMQTTGWRLLGRNPKSSKAVQEMITKEYTMSLARLDAEEEALMDQLPDFVTKLISGYRLKCFWFEIFECARKLALVCMPVWFPAGSDEQLIFGIIVCFGTFGVYMLLNPYVSIGEDRLAQLCQSQIFLVLVLSLSLRSSQESKSEAKEHNIDVTLTVIIIAPIVLSVLLDFIAFKFFFREGQGDLNKEVENTKERTSSSEIARWSILPGHNWRRSSRPSTYNNYDW